MDARSPDDNAAELGGIDVSGSAQPSGYSSGGGGSSRVETAPTPDAPSEEFCDLLHDGINSAFTITYGVIGGVFGGVGGFFAGLGYIAGEHVNHYIAGPLSGCSAMLS